MTDLNREEEKKTLISNENDIISIEDDLDELDLANKLLIRSSDNLMLEIKYPNIKKLNETNSKNRDSNNGLKNYLKIVYVKVKPLEYHNNSNNKNFLEPISLCESLLGIYPNFAFDTVSKDYKVIIQGFLPKRFTYKHSQQLKIGDLLISINDIEINSENIEQLLSAIRRSQTLKIIALTPITYVNLDTNELVLNKVEFEKKYKKNTNNKVLAPSKSTQVIQGDRVKLVDAPNQDDAYYFLMILSLNKEVTRRNSDDKNDLIYKYPNNQHEINKQQNLDTNEFLETIRGLFMTLALTIKDINNNDQVICSLIEHHDQLYNVCFLNGNFGSSGLLVLTVPYEQINLNYLKVIAKNLNQTFKFTFGDLFLKLAKTKTSNANEINERINLKDQLDCFFSQLKSRFWISSSISNPNRSLYALSNMGRNNQTAAQQEKRNYFRRYNFLAEMRSKFINSMPYLDLPADLKCDLDATLSDIEAQEFVDLEHNYYKNRRQYTIVGSCLFYKDYLISTHLNDVRTMEIYNYCEHYGLFNLVKYANTNQFHIWKEVFLSNQIPTCRYFLIVIGLKEFLFSLLLESGGIIARQITPNQIIDPEPFFIQQATFILSDIYDNGIMAEINRYFKFKTSQIIFNLNRFITIRKKSSKSIRTSSKSRSPIRTLPSENRSRSLDGKKSNKTKNISPRRSESQENEFFQDFKNVNTENISQETGLASNDDVYHYQKEHRHSSPSPSKHHIVNSVDLSNKYFSDVSLQNSIIYFATSENKTNGILFPPKLYDFSSNLFIRIFLNFTQTCFKIKNLFENSYVQEKSKEDNYLLIEQGILFNLIVNDRDKKHRSKSAERNQQSSIKSNAKLEEINFWVVGRRRLQRLNRNSKWNNMGDMFICFHDSINNILLELAFDLTFSKLAL